MTLGLDGYAYGPHNRSKSLRGPALGLVRRANDGWDEGYAELGALACSLVALMVAGGGQGTKYMETTVQDDALFLHRPAGQVGEHARQAAELGADRIRLTAGWSALAPSPRARKMPGAPFEPKESKTYPGDPWRQLDTAVKAARNAGLGVQIDLAFWAPRWAVRNKSSNPNRQRDYPSPEAFADFATAAARRYNGGHPDPHGENGSTLPTVRMWTTWNEPNHPSFLQPQWVRNKDGQWRPMSPHVYRAMHNAAYDALKRVSHDNVVLMGGTASVGSQVPGRGGVAPLRFARTLACLDDKLQPLRVPECRGFRPIKADGWAHHPYSRYVTPGTSDGFADNVPIADLGRLGGLLEELRKLGRFADRLPLYQTEYGYESKQDDPFQPFTREQQAAFIGWSTFLAWRDPDTRMMAQFLLRDIDPKESGKKYATRSYYRDWQSGLFTAAGEAKPAARAFKLPFWAQTEGTGDRKAVMLFGEVRPGKGPQVVRVERRDERTGTWAAVQTFGPSCDSENAEFLTDHGGFFLRSAAHVGAGAYRFAWQRANSDTWEHSLPIEVAEEGDVPPPVTR